VSRTPSGTRVVVVRPAGGGIAHVAAACVRELRRQGALVQEVVVADDGAPAWAGLRAVLRHRRHIRTAQVVHVELGRLSAPAFWAAFWTSLGRRLTVLVAHDVPVLVKSPGAGLVRTAPGLRDVIAHRLAARALDRLLLAVVVRRTARFVVLSEAAGAAARAAGLQPVSVVRHGADAPVAGPSPSSGSYVLFAGFLGPGKGLEVLAQAWLQVAPTSPLPLWIAGQAAPQHQRWLEGVRQQLDATGRPPVWKGFVGDEDFQALVAGAAIVVLPYTVSNPASGILVRAVVQGRAIVASAVPAVTAEVVDRTSALIVAPGDPGALAAALLDLLEDPRRRDEIGAAASRGPGAEHTWERHVAGLHQAYALANREAGR